MDFGSVPAHRGPDIRINGDIEVAGIRGLLVVALLLPLGGCGAAVMAFVDDTLTQINGDTCSMARVLRGDAICDDPRAVEKTADTKLYCYRNIARVDCYRKPDPFARLEGRPKTQKPHIGTPEPYLTEAQSAAPKRKSGGIFEPTLREDTNEPSKTAPVPQIIKKQEPAVES